MASRSASCSATSISYIQTSASSFTVTFAFFGLTTIVSRRSVAAPLEASRRRGLGAQLLVELSPLLLDGRHRFLRPLDVLGFLHRAADASCGGRGTADGAGADRLASEQRADQRRADRDRRLQLLTGGLLAFALHRLLRAPQLLVERRLLRRVFLPQPLERLVARFAGGLLQTRAEIALGLARVRSPRRSTAPGTAPRTRWPRPRPSSCFAHAG